ncbi:GroES-like protein [Daldinia eschscholtzii]|nr:GroES-like protein [Daldinia eschscholtzii]
MHPNIAAWLHAKCTKPLQVRPAPYTTPKAGEIKVQNKAVAINPVDWVKQEAGDLLLDYIRYPFVSGGDVADEVVIEVGSNVERFRVRDRVIKQAVAAAPSLNNPSEGAFKHYTVIREHLAVAITDWMTYEQARVLPLALLTAAYGLFDPSFLALSPPNKAVIITGGSFSVGSNASQLAVSARYQVYSTASPKSFAYAERLSATRVFDYHSTTWVDELVAEHQGKTLAGAFAGGDSAVGACIEVIRRCEKVEEFVAYVVVRTRFIVAQDIYEPDNVISYLVFRAFLANVLASQQLVPPPEPLVNRKRGCRRFKKG